MPSSPIADAVAQQDRASQLLDLLAAVPDPGNRRGVRYRLATVLAVSVTTVLAGAGPARPPRSASGPPTCPGSTWPGSGSDRRRRSRPCARVYARLDTDALDRVLGAWLWTGTRVVAGRRVIAIDGKTVRGARARTGHRQACAPHLLAAFDHAAAVVLGQLAIKAKSNDVPRVRDPLACFDPAGVVVSVDAMHTQTDTATAITSAGGTYVFTVKGKTPTLQRQLKALPWKDVPAHSVTDTGHGRRATRTIKVVPAPDWVDFPGAAQVAQVRRSVTKQGNTTVEVVYLITSAETTAAFPATVAAWVQGHWGSETRLHYVRDVTLERTSPPSAPDSHPGSWPRCVTPPSACSDWPAGTTSPKPYDTTPATQNAPSHAC